MGVGWSEGWGSEMGVGGGGGQAHTKLAVGMQSKTLQYYLVALYPSGTLLLPYFVTVTVKGEGGGGVP